MTLFTIPVTATNDLDGMPILIIGVTALGEYLAIDGDGKSLVLTMPDVTFNWRYDWRVHRWLDIGDVDDTQSDPPDGGSDLSGSVPEPDEFGSSDSLDPAGGQAPRDPGDLDTGET